MKTVFHSHLQRSFNHIPDVTGNMEFEWAMFRAAIAEAAAQIFGSKVTCASRGGNSRTPLVDTGGEREKPYDHVPQSVLLGCSEGMEWMAFCYRLSNLCIIRVRAWFALLAVSQTRSQSGLVSAKAVYLVCLQICNLKLPSTRPLKQLLGVL